MYTHAKQKFYIHVSILSGILFFRKSLRSHPTQLAVELIALAEAEGQNELYGAVTIGNVWQFGYLDVQSKKIIQIASLYRIPEDIEELAQILVGIINQ